MNTPKNVKIEDFELEQRRHIQALEDAQAEWEHTHWAGDGSGLDDLADYNANEAMDYLNE